MANTAVTLQSGVVSTVTVEGDHEAIEVVQLAGTPVGRGPITSSAMLELGQPSEHYAFAVWDRALSNAEVALLSPGFPVVP